MYDRHLDIGRMGRHIKQGNVAKGKCDRRLSEKTQVNLPHKSTLPIFSPVSPLFLNPLNCTTSKMHVPTLTLALSLTSYASAQLQKVNDFNAGPTKLGMYAYIPKTLTKPAPVIVGVHHCQGSATAYSSESQLMPKADKYGIILVFPNSKSSGGCFDVASDASTLFAFSFGCGGGEVTVGERMGGRGREEMGVHCD